MRFDHVVYVAADLNAGAAAVADALAIEVTGGGVHEGQGTHNALLAFPGGYVEVLGLVDPAAPPASPLGAAVAMRLADGGDGLLGWAVAVDDVEAVARRLDTPLMTIAREGFSARLTGVGEAMAEPALPFFIQRDPGVPAPFPDGDALEALVLEGSVERLGEWLGETPPYVEVGPGDGGVRAVTVAGRMLS